MKTGNDLLKTIKAHPDRKTCPRCGEDVGRVALVDLVYTFEACECAAAKYRHLEETIYHRACFLRLNPELITPTPSPE
jgi:hypothetical protein